MKTKMKIEKEVKKPKVWRRIARATKVFVSGALLVAGLVLFPGTARADSIEVMAGNKKTTMDIKAGASLTDKVGLFTRLRPSTDYKGNMDTFGLMDLYINLFGPVDAVTEFQLAGGQVTPRGGLQYFGKLGDFSLYTMLTFGLGEAKDVEHLAVLAYNPKFNELFGLLVRAENLANFGKEGNNWTVQRLRLGLTADKFRVGGAVDLLELGNTPNLGDGTFGWNAGGFGEVTF